MCSSDLPTFNRPNVTLVDTHGRGVERITERAVVVDGEEYELDCLIFATGFEVGTSYKSRAGFEVIGHDGLTLTEAWALAAQCADIRVSFIPKGGGGLAGRAGREDCWRQYDEANSGFCRGVWGADGRWGAAGSPLPRGQIGRAHV